MKRGNYKNKLHITILYSIVIIGIAINIILNNNITLENKTEIIKTMDETTEVANLNKTIDDLNASKTEYSNYINTSKTNLAKAITSAGVSTSGTDSLETMITNVSKILSTKTNDATATAASILSGKTAYVKGSKVTGTMANNGAVTKTLSAGGSYTIPAGYHNGSGKVTANSLASQTQATATADNISKGKTAWVNGQLITGNGTDNSNYLESLESTIAASGGGSDDFVPRADYTYTATEDCNVLFHASVVVSGSYIVETDGVCIVDTNNLSGYVVRGVSTRIGLYNLKKGQYIRVCSYNGSSAHSYHSMGIVVLK